MPLKLSLPVPPTGIALAKTQRTCVTSDAVAARRVPSAALTLSAASAPHDLPPSTEKSAPGLSLATKLTEAGIGLVTTKLSAGRGAGVLVGQYEDELVARRDQLGLLAHDLGLAVGAGDLALDEHFAGERDIVGRERRDRGQQGEDEEQDFHVDDPQLAIVTWKVTVRAWPAGTVPRRTATPAGEISPASPSARSVSGVPPSVIDPGL